MNDYSLRLLKRSEYEDWLRGINEKNRRRTKKKLCPFCDYRENQIVLHTGKHWLWIACRAPYWKYHTMFVPKRHVVTMDELTIVEFGELVEMYQIAVKKYKEKRIKIDGQLVKKYILFWRLREDPYELRTNNLRLLHFHLHLTPDREGLFDTILSEHATDWNPGTLRIER